MSPSFYQVLEKLLAPNINHRFQSINELETAMNQIHLDHELKHCLTHKPLGNSQAKLAEACAVELPVEETQGHSPASRQAKAIRRWQQRRRQFETFTP